MTRAAAKAFTTKDTKGTKESEGERVDTINASACVRFTAVLAIWKSIHHKGHKEKAMDSELMLLMPTNACGFSRCR